MIGLLKAQPFRNILLLAVLLRLLIMPFFFHPDIKTYTYQVSHLKNGVTNIYQYISENKEHLSIRDSFTYFPLTYFVFGGYQILIAPLLGPDFSNWLADASSQSVERIGVYRYLFLLKFPYLIIDIVIAFLLTKLFSNLKEKISVFALWLFNPFSLILIYVYSGIDILPVLFSILGLFFLHKKKMLSSAIMMGLAAAFKGYTLLFLPFLLLIGKNIKSKILLVIFLLAPFLFIILPFLLAPSFVEQALVSGLTSRLFLTAINMGFGESLMVTITAVSFLFFYLLLDQEKSIEPWHYLLALLLILFSTIHYHMQWLLWILPFVIIFAVKYEQLKKLILLWLGLAFVIPLLYDDRSMTVSIFSVISSAYNLLPTPHLFLERIYDPYLVLGAIHSVMLALAFVLIWKSFNISKI